MTMSVLPILESSTRDTEMRAALAAGWRRRDLYWERLQEAGNAAILAGDIRGASRAWHRAAWVARLAFAASDPRQATTLANLACLDRQAGREARAKKQYVKARARWQQAETFIAGMSIARRGRSSMFHLRMEVLHWDTYENNMRIRLRKFAGETADALAALEQNRTPDCRLFERWRGEKPSVFDDTRKFLSAALLVAGGAQSPKIQT
jgi:hypothetical protein